MTIRLLLQLVFLFLTSAAQAVVGGSFADENGCEQVIATTDEHPFWVVNKDAWVEAKDLQIGDTFLGTNGELSTLIETYHEEFTDGVTVYNFTVDGNHDYLVIAQTGEYGQTCILVHNAGEWYKISNHAKKRSLEGRPISSAFGDAKAASQNNVLVQDDGRYIVLGRNSRVHVFDADGTLITSWSNTKANTQKRIQEGRWIRITADQFERFKDIVGGY